LASSKSFSDKVGSAANAAPDEPAKANPANASVNAVNGILLIT